MWLIATILDSTGLETSLGKMEKRKVYCFLMLFRGKSVCVCVQVCACTYL